MTKFDTNFDKLCDRIMQVLVILLMATALAMVWALLLGVFSPFRK